MGEVDDLFDLTASLSAYSGLWAGQRVRFRKVAQCRKYHHFKVNLPVLGASIVFRDLERGAKAFSDY